MKEINNYISEKLKLDKDIKISSYDKMSTDDILKSICKEFFPKGKYSVEKRELLEYKNSYVIEVYLGELRANDKKIFNAINKIKEVIDINDIEYYYVRLRTPFYYQINVYL